MNYKVKKSDLKGDIKDFPVEVVQEMVNEQVRQGNKADVEAFQKYRFSDKSAKGFEWVCTKECEKFWNEVIFFKKFDVFFSKYPKQIDLTDSKTKQTQNTVKEKKSAKRVRRNLTDVKLLVTNRNRKAVIAFLDEVCERIWSPVHLESNLCDDGSDYWLYFVKENMDDWGIFDLNDNTHESKEQVTLKTIKRIHTRLDNEKKRTLNLINVVEETDIKPVSIDFKDCFSTCVYGNATPFETEFQIIKETCELTDLKTELEQKKAQNQSLVKELDNFKFHQERERESFKVRYDKLERRKEEIESTLKKELKTQDNLNNRIDALTCSVDGYKEVCSDKKNLIESYIILVKELTQDSSTQRLYKNIVLMMLFISLVVIASILIK